MGYAASCSVSDKVLWQMLHDYPFIKRVFLCFDSDNAGKEAAKKIAEKLSGQNIECEILGLISAASHMYNLNGIKSKTVGDGQHGAARFATGQELLRTFKKVPYSPDGSGLSASAGRPMHWWILLTCIP